MLLGALVIMLHSLVACALLPSRAVSLQAFEPRVPHAALRRDNRVRRLYYRTDRVDEDLLTKSLRVEPRPSGVK